MIKEFTDISDPYEVPQNPEFTIATETCLPDEAAERVIRRPRDSGYFDRVGQPASYLLSHAQSNKIIPYQIFRIF